MDQLNIKKLYYENEIESYIQRFKNFSGTKDDCTFLSDGLEVDNNILEDRLEKLKFKNRELTVKIQEIKSIPVMKPLSQVEVDINDYLLKNHLLITEKKKLKKGIDNKSRENEQILEELDDYQSKRSEYIQSNLKLHEDYKELERDYKKLNLSLCLKTDQILKTLEKKPNNKQEINLDSIQNASSSKEILRQYNKLSSEVYTLTQQIVSRANKKRNMPKIKEIVNSSSAVVLENEGKQYN